MTLAKEFFHLDGGSSKPLYHQIQDNIVQLIDHDLLRSGDALPSERLLGEYYSVNRMTVRQAIDALVQRGLLRRRHGSGTFVNDQPAMQALQPTVVGFSERMRKEGLRPSSRLLHRTITLPEPIVAHRLNISREQQVIIIKRLRLINDVPLMLETSYLSSALFPELLERDLENESLYDILAQDYDMKVVEAEHTLEPTLASAYEAQHLGIDLRTPAMLVRVLAYSQDRVPIEFSKSIVRGDRCRYFFRVNTAMPILD
jgi:GntR family transcriptional regulator